MTEQTPEQAGAGALLPYSNTGVTIRLDEQPAPAAISEADRQWLVQYRVNYGYARRASKPDRMLYDQVQQGVIIGSVSCDWLRLTTWSRTAFLTVLEFLGEIAPDAALCKAAKVQQYAGQRGSGWFAGIGHQMTEGQYYEHYMLDFSGAVAHQVLDHLLNNPSLRQYLPAFNCTRCDVQYTLEDETPEIDIGETAQASREVEWGNPWRRPRIDVYDREDGLSTMYIGHRSSARMQRIYRKDTGEQQLLRWETEFKDRLSSLIWDRLQLSGILVLQTALAAEITSAPVTDDLLALFADIDAPPERLKVSKDTTDARRRVAWLMRVALGCAQKLRASLADSDPAYDSVRSEYMRFLEAIEAEREEAERRLTEKTNTAEQRE